MKISKTLQHDVTLSFFWIGLFTIVFAGLTVWYMKGKLEERTQELEQKIEELEVCLGNMEEISKQIGSGRIILELKWKTNVSIVVNLFW